MSKTRGGWLFSLRVKLVAVLIPLTVLSMLVVMVGLGKFLHEFFQRRAELETAQLGRAVELALRQSMLRKPDLALSETLADVEKTPGVRRVWVVDAKRFTPSSDVWARPAGSPWPSLQS
jgi:hypothetical protein